MAVLSIAETVTRPAAETLEAWFPAPVAASSTQRDALIAEQHAVAAAIAATVARMGTEPDLDLLDELTEETTVLFARAEEIRLALALAARAANDTWLASVDFD
jgi:hypothetical protein